MSLLRGIEQKLEGLFQGTFSKAFKSEVQPIELARKLAKDMSDSKTVSISRTYVPNQYTVYLSPQDRQTFEGWEDAARKELSDYLLQYARDAPAQGKAFLVGAGKRTVLSGSRVLLGRSRDCDIQLDDPNTSRRHAEVRREGNAWVIADLGSTNGIKVNGSRVAEAELHQGDEVTLGLIRLRFEQE